MTHCHSDEPISDERTKKMTFYVFNEELKSEADVIKLVQEKTMLKDFNAKPIDSKKILNCFDHFKCSDHFWL